MEEIKLRGQLFKKLAKISKKIGKLEKDGTNKHANWSFVSAEKMLAECRSKFDESGIYLISAVIPSLTKHEDSGSTTTKGAIIFKTTVTMKFNWVDCDSGYVSDDILFSGQDQDASKSFSQAITDCHKRFLFKAFNVSSASDGDPDNKTIELARTIQSNNAETRRKFIKIYNESKLDKIDKDTIIESMKLQHGEDITKWDDKAHTELETKLNKKPKKNTPPKSLDEITKNGVDLS